MEEKEFKHKLNIMCSNWIFLHDRSLLENCHDIREHKALIDRYRIRVWNSPMFDIMVKPMLNSNCDNFYEVQEKVFKILDMREKEDKMKEDFNG